MRLAASSNCGRLPIAFVYGMHPLGNNAGRLRRNLPNVNLFKNQDGGAIESRQFLCTRACQAASPSTPPANSGRGRKGQTPTSSARRMATRI